MILYCALTRAAKQDLEKCSSVEYIGFLVFDLEIWRAVFSLF